jgi:hypothetical protein
MLYNSGSMWPSIVVHEHWPVSQRMIVEMGDYTWSEHIVMVFLACQITIKNVQVQLTVRQRPFSTAGALRSNLAFGGHISTCTVIRRLHHQGMRARRPIKRPQLTLRHYHARFDWSHDHLGWTIRTWRWVHWSNESRFLLRPTDDRARVWRQRNTSSRSHSLMVEASDYSACANVASKC